MDHLNEAIQTSFEAISLILVFLIIFFDIRYPKIQEDIQLRIPEGEDAKNRHRKKLTQSLFVNCGILLTINGIALYLFLPMFVKVMKESSISFWNFDFLRSSFVFVVFMVFVLFVWIGYLSVQMIRRIYKSK